MARVTIPTKMNSSGTFIISPYKRSQPSVKPISRRKAPRVTTMTITSNMELPSETRSFPALLHRRRTTPFPLCSTRVVTSVFERTSKRSFREQEQGPGRRCAFLVCSRIERMHNCVCPGPMLSFGCKRTRCHLLFVCSRRWFFRNVHFSFSISSR